jgi:hypothetical protein
MNDIFQITIKILSILPDFVLNNIIKDGEEHNPINRNATLFSGETMNYRIVGEKLEDANYLEFMISSFYYHLENTNIGIKESDEKYEATISYYKEAYIRLLDCFTFSEFENITEVDVFVSKISTKLNALLDLNQPKHHIDRENQVLYQEEMQDFSLKNIDEQNKISFTSNYGKDLHYNLSQNKNLKRITIQYDNKNLQNVSNHIVIRKNGFIGSEINDKHIYNEIFESASRNSMVIIQEILPIKDENNNHYNLIYGYRTLDGICESYSKEEIERVIKNSTDVEDFKNLMIYEQIDIPGFTEGAIE